jgi:hypothetical protein
MDFDQEVTPVREYITKRERIEKKKSFFRSYPELKPFGDDVIAAVASKIPASEVQGKTPKEVNTILAKKVEAAIVKIKPDFRLSSQANSGGPNPRPASMSSGGGGGAGGRGPSRPKGASSIWD